MHRFARRVIPATVALSVVIGLIAWGHEASSEAVVPEATASGEGSTPASGFAVVELFTSEGCSSCPPADRLLAQIDAFAEKSDAPVYVLSFHVDYWNQLGWADPYSSAEHTARQRSYAAAAGERSVYTPQLIVNGDDRFVGSDGKRAQAALNKVLAVPAAIRLSIDAQADAGEYVVTYRTADAPAGSVVNVALVQAQGSQAVRRGENTGRTLRHVNIVRAFRSVDLDRSGSGVVRLEEPAGVEGPPRVIVYLQDEQTKRVVSAVSTTVS